MTDKLYAVYDGYGGFVLESAEVKKRTKKLIFITGVGLAFGCASQVGPGRFAETPEQALEEMHASLKKDRDHAVKQLEEYEAWLATNPKPESSR